MVRLKVRGHCNQLKLPTFALAWLFHFLLAAVDDGGGIRSVNQCLFSPQSLTAILKR